MLLSLCTLCLRAKYVCISSRVNHHKFKNLMISSAHSPMLVWTIVVSACNASFKLNVVFMLLYTTPMHTVV